MEITRAGDNASRRGPADYFTGIVWIDPINEAPEPARVSVLRVSFTPGARTAWHTHRLGQTLHVIAGLGLIQKQNEPIREIRPGDTIWIAPGEMHWHGATPDNAMTHLAIQEVKDGTATDWHDHVSDADYRGK